MDSKLQPTVDFPATLSFPRNLDYCCIYKVQDSIRKVNPEAYTPQLVLIGPLHRSLASQALAALGRGENITFTRPMGYLDMEKVKKGYLENFTKRICGKRRSPGEGEEIIRGFRKTIEKEEKNIRESYSLSTEWIKSFDFVEMVLHDSVFIVEFMLRGYKLGYEKIGDPLRDDPTLTRTVSHDLILLENQLPYFILDKLFNAVVPKISPNQTFRKLVLWYFQFEGKIREDSKFGHFTDLHRCVLLETLPKHNVKNSNHIEHIKNADKLESWGVKFEAVEEEFSLNVRFENGCLKMPRLKVDDELEITLRNIMALEKCHYPDGDPVCSYVLFLDNLINNVKDVDLLVKKGIIEDSTGEPASASRMVNKLGRGIIRMGSYYSDLAVEVNNYSKSKVKRSKAILKNVYFPNAWVGIATIAAIALVVFALIQTWASITQVNQNKTKN